MTERAIRRYTPRQNILFAFAVAIALAAAWYARDVLVLIYVSALLAVVLMPLIRAIMHIHIYRWAPGRGLAIAILLVGLGVALTGFFVFALPPVVKDMHNFVLELPGRIPQISARIHDIPFLRNQNLNLNARAQAAIATGAHATFAELPIFAHGIFRLLTGIVLVIYFMIEGDESYAWLLRLVPPAKRNRLENTLLRAEQRMSKWLLGQGTLMLILGLCSLVAFYLLHLRYFYALAVLMGLFNIVPVIGALITVPLAMMVGALDSWTKVAGVAIFYAIYVNVENAYLTPRIMKSSVDLAGLATIVALLFGAAYAGVIGALVAVPSAVLIVVLIEEYAMRGAPVPQSEVTAATAPK